MKIKVFFESKIIEFLNSLATLLVMQTANSACIWVAHQPDFPKEAEKFIRRLQKDK